MDGPAADALVRDTAGALVRLDEGLGRELYSIACPPDAQDLVRAIDAALERLAPELRELDARHGLQSAER